MAYDGKWKIIFSDSYSDDELEMLAVAAMAMEKLNTENSSAIRRGSIQGHSVIFRNRVEGHIAIILLNRLPIPQIYFEGGFE